MNQLLEAIGTGVVLGVTFGLMFNLLCLCIRKYFPKKVKTDEEIMSELKNSDLYAKIKHEASVILSNASKDDGEKFVIQAELTYISNPSTWKQLCLLSYREEWENTHNCKYVSVFDRLMKFKENND